MEKVKVELISDAFGLSIRDKKLKDQMALDYDSITDIVDFEGIRAENGEITVPIKKAKLWFDDKRYVVLRPLVR